MTTNLREATPTVCLRARAASICAGFCRVEVTNFANSQYFVEVGHLVIRGEAKNIRVLSTGRESSYSFYAKREPKDQILCQSESF